MVLETISDFSALNYNFYPLLSIYARVPFPFPRAPSFLSPYHSSKLLFPPRHTMPLCELERQCDCICSLPDFQNQISSQFAECGLMLQSQNDKLANAVAQTIWCFKLKRLRITLLLNVGLLFLFVPCHLAYLLEFGGVR